MPRLLLTGVLTTLSWTDVTRTIRPWTKVQHLFWCKSKNVTKQRTFWLHFPGYPNFGNLLNDTGRPMVYSCSWPVYQEEAGQLVYWLYFSDWCKKHI